MRPWWLYKIGKFVLFAAIALTVLSTVVMVLWNALVPELFHGPMISFWQAVGLLVLSHLLLRGWGRWHYGNGWRHERWRRRLDAKLAAMSPEEREKFKNEWKHRCGHHWEEESHSATDNEGTKS